MSLPNSSKQLTLWQTDMAKKKKKPIRETDLYGPIKAFLEGQGYEVKGEVGAADIVAVRGDEPPVIVELKTAFSLALFHQAIERLKLSDTVYVAVPRKTGKAFQTQLRRNIAMCRRLGIGLITVRMSAKTVEAHLDPGPYLPRKNKQKSERLLQEFSRRVGDPNKGGRSSRGKLMTAYRQDAIRCLGHLHACGPTKASDVAKATGVQRARNIMADDHYGWFERAERGIYRITPKGIEAASEYAGELKKLAA